MVVAVETLALVALAAAVQGRGRSSRDPRAGPAGLVPLAVLVVGCERSPRDPRALPPQYLLPWRPNAWLSSSLLRRLRVTLRPLVPARWLRQVLR